MPSMIQLHVWRLAPFLEQQRAIHDGFVRVASPDAIPRDTVVHVAIYLVNILHRPQQKAQSISGIYERQA
jgi:hypothetical protein